MATVAETAFAAMRELDEQWSWDMNLYLYRHGRPGLYHQHWHLIQVPAYGLRKQWWIAQVLGPLHHVGDTKESSGSHLQISSAHDYYCFVSKLYLLEHAMPSHAKLTSSTTDAFPRVRKIPVA